MERIYLNEKDVIVQDENNLVNVTLADGTVIEHLEPRRLFPVSSPTQYITFLDAEFVERCVVRNMGDISPDARKIVEAALADYYLVPIILRIIKKEEKYGILHWTVETDRGERSFDIRNRNHDIRRLPDGRIRVRDSNDNRYIIRDVEALDTHSRNLLIEDM